MVEVNGAGTLLVVKLPEIPSTGGDMRSWTFGFPGMVPVTLIENEVVWPGATVLELGFTKRFQAYTEGIPAPITSMENKTKTAKAARIFFKTNHREISAEANMVNSTM
jgi:hypothetical protein